MTNSAAIAYNPTSHISGVPAEAKTIRSFPAVVRPLPERRYPSRARKPFAGVGCDPFTPLGREPFRLLTSVHASPDGAADSNRSRVWWISRPRHPFLRLQATSIITLLSTDFQYGRETDPLVPCAYPRPSRRVAPKPLFSVRQLERGASHLTKKSAGHMYALGQVHPLV